MTFRGAKVAMLSLALIAGAAMGRAQTVTVGPSGQYATPCQAFPHLSSGETVQIDANGGVPYNDSTDCTISADNLTIVGVNGRAVMDGTGLYTAKGLWIMNGHDNVIDNIEFRNASGQQNAAGVRIQIADGGSGTDGGNITIQHSYLHNNGDGVLGANSGNGASWYSANPYITFQYDEFAYNSNLDGVGNTHNMYMGVGGNMDFTLQYSWTHDSFVGHTVKTRAPYNNILYDMDTDASGTSSYLLDFCLGGSDYVIGNVLYKGPVTNGNTSQNWMIYADVNEDSDGGEYPAANQDLHFINNTVVDDPSNTYPPQFVSIACGNSTQSSCPAPNAGGPAETVPTVIENNIFVGPSGNAITNQNGVGGGPTAYVAGNVVQTYSDSQLAADFVDWAHYDFHLVSGSPAIQAGIYPPTNNTGASDPNALAKYEFVMPTGAVARPTPSGSTMDAGAYSYPRVGSVPSINLSYTQSVTAPGTGTITITGLPTPPSGQYNYAAFVSQNTAAVPHPPSADSTTGTITTTFTVNPAVTTSTVVSIDVYAMGAHAVANVTVNPGPPVLSSITQDYNYAPFSSVHLEGPAPAGGTVIDLSSSDPTYLYVPSSVTVPEGQISAETGSNTGSLWGQNPGVANETITATQGSVQKSVTIGVFTPGFHSTETEYNSVTGGTPLAWCVVMVGYWPNSGGSIQVSSDNPSIIPNQTLTSGYGGCNGEFNGQVVNFTGGVNFDGDIAIATNPVSTPTTVNVTVTLNGASTSPTPITVEPGSSAPAAPSGLSATAASSTGINLSWTASTTSGVSYSVYRDVTNGFTPGSGNQIASGLSGTTYSDTGLTASTTYYYVVEAVNGGGNSSPSNQASATTSSSGGGSGDVVAINSDGPAVGSYAADEYVSGGNDSSFSATVDTSAVTNPPPQAVYNTQRWGNFTYTIPGLTPGSPYTVRLHFAEEYWSGTGQREFNVSINGTQVLSNFDILATAGAMNKAVAESFNTTANSSGQIVIAFTQGAVDNPALNALEIQAGGSGGSGTLPSGIILNGNATQVSSSDLRLTDGGGNEASSAWAPTPVNVQAFTNDFTFQLTNANADGFTFTIQNNGTSAIGAYGGGLGYQGMGSSVAVKFDLWDNSGEGTDSTGLYTDGAAPMTPATDLSSTGINLHSGDVIKVHMTYDGTTLTVTETDQTTNATATQNYTVDIPGTVGGNTAYVGFTAGTGGATATQDILAWNYTVNPVNTVMLSSITADSPYNSGTTVHLTAAAPAGGAVINLTTSNSSIEYVPATVTVPAGQTSAETGSLLGSLWGQSPFYQQATVTATYNGSSQSVTFNVPTASLHAFSPNGSVMGGQPLGFYMESSFNEAPVGGGQYTISSDQPSIIPTQTFTLAAGQSNDFGKSIATNTVSATTTVNVTINYNGATQTSAVTVNP